MKATQRVERKRKDRSDRRDRRRALLFRARCMTILSRQCPVQSAATVPRDSQSLLRRPPKECRTRADKEMGFDASPEPARNNQIRWRLVMYDDASAHRCPG